MSLSVFEMHSVELCCQRPLGVRYVICDEWYYKACLGKAADLKQAKADTREFLGIAELNRGEWEKNRELVKRILKRHWLTLHGVQDRNPDADGWWIIRALLDEVRRGALLAIKGRRADLFPPPDCTPMRTFAAREVDLPNGESVLASRYVPITWQTPLVTARTAMSSGSSDGSLLDGAVAAIDGSAGHGDASTLHGDAQPFAYIPDAVSGEADELAASTNNPRFAAKMLGYDYKTFGTMLHKFKDNNGLGPADNSIFHDNGDVEFKGQIFEDSIHDYAP